MTCEPSLIWTWLIWTWHGLTWAVVALAAVLYALALYERRRAECIRDGALADMRAMLDRHAGQRGQP